MCAAARGALKTPGLNNVILLDNETVPGAGLPVAIGAKAAKEESRVFLLTESEPLKQHSREFQTMTRYNLPVTSFVFPTGKNKPEGEVDYVKLAESFGVKGINVPRVSGLPARETITAGNSALFDLTNLK